MFGAHGANGGLGRAAIGPVIETANRTAKLRGGAYHVKKDVILILMTQASVANGGVPHSGLDPEDECHITYAIF